MIGAKIKKLRQAKEMSISELAEEAGVAKSYLSAIERNLQTNPSILFMEKVSIVLEVSIDVLIRKDEQSSLHQLDSEWLEIFQEARDCGVSKERIKDYLAFHRWRQSQH